MAPATGGAFRMSGGSSCVRQKNCSGRERDMSAATIQYMCCMCVLVKKGLQTTVSQINV